MSIHLQPSVTLVKTEPPTVIKNEPPESEIVEIGIDDILDSSESEEKIIPDVKDIVIVYHPVCEYPIKSEILESKHCESVETEVLVKAENSPIIKTENVIQRNKDISDGNVSKGIGQEMVEVNACVASNKHYNALSKLETDEQSALNISKNLNGISVRSRKSKSPNTTLWKKEKEKIKVIKAPVIPVEAHEYTSLAKDRHVCNHCQRACNTLNDLKKHIQKIHREVTTMYQCPYCLYESKWSVRQHIISKHKDTKDIQWFQCNLCEMKFKLKHQLSQHMKKIHLKHKQMNDGLDVHKRYHCNNCDYKTDTLYILKRHNLVHLKPEKIEYFYCYHCSFKCQRKDNLKPHIFGHHFKKVKQVKRYGCNKCDYKTYRSTQLKMHKLTHSKPEDIPYFHCYHCSHKSKQKGNLQRHIFKHLKNGEVRFDCYICNYMTQKRETIIEHINKHSQGQIKFEINNGS